MDPSFEDPSSPTTSQPRTRPMYQHRRRENRCANKTIEKSCPKKTDEENLDVQTAGIKR
jgi:hypothetical protein